MRKNLGRAQAPVVVVDRVGIEHYGEAVSYVEVMLESDLLVRLGPYRAMFRIPVGTPLAFRVEHNEKLKILTLCGGVGFPVQGILPFNWRAQQEVEILPEGLGEGQIA